MAADPVAAQILIGLGIDELSMSAGSLTKVRYALHQKTILQHQAIAKKALLQKDAPSVKQLFQEKDR
jgi:phosphocarrier protein FPr